MADVHELSSIDDRSSQPRHHFEGNTWRIVAHRNDKTVARKQCFWITLTIFNFALSGVCFALLIDIMMREPNEGRKDLLNDYQAHTKKDLDLTGTPGINGSKGDRGSIGPSGQKGEKGDRGSNGTNGLTGQPGPKGDVGETGHKGDTGLTGLSGVTGNIGAKGDQGATGRKGEKGERGINGTDGLMGRAGQKGMRGGKGDRGEKGDIGQTGTFGLDGDKGSKGNKGSTGPPGSIGPKGAMGEPGITGTNGTKGQTGAKGSKGQHGVIGAKGDIGPVGLQGVKGSRGAKGEIGLMGENGLIGTKGEKGEIGLDGFNGTDGEKGDKGDSGIMGLKGTKGKPGVTGPTGRKGQPGTTGPKGTTGMRGDPGLIGPKGDKGNDGTVGVKGDKGATGVMGMKGNKGIAGSIGSRGSTGLKGLKGEQGFRGIKGQKGGIGAPGTNGSRGDTGHIGLKGEIGPVGPKGSSGSNGAKGGKGVKGVQQKGQKGECDITALRREIKEHTRGVRLVGGRVNEGRVEVFHNGIWGTICGDGWSTTDGNVVCRMLGYSQATSAPGNATHGQGEGIIWLDDVACHGSETDINSCPKSSWGQHNCDHSKDASVSCKTGVRLAGGTERSGGRVEIQYHGVWGTVCDDNWDIQDGRVICHMLGYGRAISAPRGARYGVGSGPIWLDEVRCSGSETDVEECSKSSWGQHNCDHSKDASVSCKTGVRLAGGSGWSGRVEIQYDGVWGTVCHDYWDTYDATVICRMLGYSRTISAFGSARYGQGSGPVWLDDVRCSGSETDIGQCSKSSWGEHNCDHSDDASVICGNVVRLAGGSERSGRVEIKYHGEWGTVCHDNWDIQDGTVICRMLGHGRAVSAPGFASYGQGSGRVWLDNVECLGNETDVVECSKSSWGEHNCDHSKDASVYCVRRVRLAGTGSKFFGRVEILYRGVWGTVCDDYWDIQDAKVICRMLGYARATSAHDSATYGQGSGRVWLDNVDCSGSETEIDQCPKNEWGDENCDHDEDASVGCA